MIIKTMAQQFYGSIDFTKVLEEARKGNKAFSKAANGKIYLNVNIWLNDEQDQYNNIGSIQANFKDATKEERFYLGNFKRSEPKTKPLQENSAEIPEDDDLPF